MKFYAEGFKSARRAFKAYVAWAGDVAHATQTVSVKIMKKGDRYEVSARLA